MIKLCALPAFRGVAARTVRWEVPFLMIRILGRLKILGMTTVAVAGRAAKTSGQVTGSALHSNMGAV